MIYRLYITIEGNVKALDFESLEDAMKSGSQIYKDGAWFQVGKNFVLIPSRDIEAVYIQALEPEESENGKSK
jgi:hypothetical protein